MKRSLLLGLFFMALFFTSITAEAVDLPEDPGTYPVEVEYIQNEERLTKTIFVTVTGEQTEIFGNLALDANNFSLNIEEANQVSREELIEWANAIAWRTDNGERLPLTEVTHTIQPVAGEYPVRFTSGEHSISVIATVTGPETLMQKEVFLDSWLFRLLLSVTIFIGMLIPIVLLLFSSQSLAKTTAFLTEYFERKG